MPEEKATTKNKHHIHPIAQLLGASAAGATEIAVFHPYDTIAKRLQTNTLSISSLNQLNQTLFNEAYNKSILQKTTSLYAGLQAGVYYKISQRVFKFAGQPEVKRFLTKHHAEERYENWFGKKYAHALVEASAGSLIGGGEALLLSPLDAAKVKKQTNQAYKKLSLVQIIKQEKLHLYNGLQWTLARNFPGSFCLFGGSAMADQMLAHTEIDHKKKKLIASGAGAFSSILLTNPQDVMKTRMQKVQGRSSASEVFVNTLRHEGVPAFFKGVTVKLLTQGPKVTVSFTLAKLFSEWFNQQLTARETVTGKFTLFSSQPGKVPKVSHLSEFRFVPGGH